MFASVFAFVLVKNPKMPFLTFFSPSLDIPDVLLRLLLPYIASYYTALLFPLRIILDDWSSFTSALENSIML